MIKRCASLLILMVGSMAAHAQRNLASCYPDVKDLTTAVTNEMFDQDAVYKEFDPNADVYLRIVEEPGWKTDDSYYQIRLVKKTRAGLSRNLVVKYTIPQGSGDIYALVKKRLRTSPCISARQLAAELPIKRTTTEMTDELRSVAIKVFDLNLRPVPLNHDVVREDATKFTLEVIGECRLRVSSDDHELEFVRWIIDLENAINAKS